MHRDFKPANLVRTGDGRLVLLDFGTVVRAKTSIEYERGSYGTVAYQAPEQIRQDGTLDGRSDLYALGIILYRMAAGQRPFRGTIDDVIGGHLERDPLPPSRYAPLSGAFDDLVLKALAKDPADRWEDASAMATAVGELRSSPPPGRLAWSVGRLLRRS